MNDLRKTKVQLLEEKSELSTGVSQLQRSPAEHQNPFSEEKFEILADQSPNMIFINLEGRIIYANRRCVEMMGYSREELYSPNFNFLSLISPEFKHLVAESYSRHLRGEEVENYECTLLTRDENLIDVIISTKLITVSGKRAILGIVTDISDRKAMETALKESENRYQKLLELSFEGTVIHQDGKIVSINQEGAEVLGAKEPKDLIGKEVFTLIHPEYKEIILGRIQNNDEEASLMEEKFIGLDGRTIDAEVAGIPVIYNGKPARQVVFRDISKRKQAEAELRRSRELYRKLVDTLPDAVIVVDLDGNMTNVSSKALELFGYEDTSELLGKNGFMFLDPSSREAATKNLLKTFEQQIVRGEEYLVRRKDGSTFLAEVNATILKGADEKPVGFITTIKDITDRKHYEEQLQSFASRLTLTEEKERRKIANEIHDRLGQSLALTKIKLSELQTSEDLKIISASLDDIRKILEKLIEETRTLTFELSPPVLYELGLEPAIEWLVEEFQSRYHLSVRIEDDGQEKPLSNEIRFILFDAVRELLINVVKHARAKRITISLLRRNGFYHINVIDDGAGFDIAKLKRSKSNNRNFGFFQIKERLKWLDGEMIVQSAPGKGTNVLIKAPLK